MSYLLAMLIRQRRQALGKSVAEMAEELGIPEESLRSCEMGGFPGEELWALQPLVGPQGVREEKRRIDSIPADCREEAEANAISHTELALRQWGDLDDDKEASAGSCGFNVDGSLLEE